MLRKATGGGLGVYGSAQISVTKLQGISVMRGWNVKGKVIPQTVGSHEG